MGVSRLKNYKPTKYRVKALAIISEREMIGLCKRYNIAHTFFENQPLGRKKNFGLNKAMEMEWDYLMELNSDDVIHPELLDQYGILIGKGAEYMGLQNFTILDSKTGDMRQVSSDTVYGIGRMYSRKAVETSGKVTGVKIKQTCLMADEGGNQKALMKGKVYDLRPEVARGLISCDFAERMDHSLKLWDDEATAGMDNFSNKRLNGYGFECERIFTGRPLAVDIKSDVNIWAYNPEAGQPYLWNDFKAGLDSKIIEKIECLKQN